MKKRALFKALVLSVACMLLLTGEMISAPLFEKGYYDYEGTIGQDIRVQISFYPLGNEIVGSHFYEMYRYPMTLKGKLEGDEITIYEFDEHAKNTGIFKGKITAGRVRRKIVSNLFIRGTWSSSDGKRTLPFSLRLKYTMPDAEYGKRYKIAGAVSDAEVEKEIKMLQQHIIKNDKEYIAEMVHYPLEISSLDRKSWTINTKAEFLQQYETIFHPEFKRIMGDAFTMNMLATSDGIMFSDALQCIRLKYYQTGKQSMLMISRIYK